MLRLEIPMFERDKPWWWISRCEHFFYHYRIAEGSQVNMEAAYLNDVADSWFQGWSKQRMEWRKPEFIEELCAHFGE